MKFNEISKIHPSYRLFFIVSGKNELSMKKNKKMYKTWPVSSPLNLLFEVRTILLNNPIKIPACF